MDERHTIEYELTDELSNRLGKLMVDRYFYGHAFQRQAPWILLAILGVLIGLFFFEVIQREVFGFLLVVLAMLVGYAWFRRLLLHRDLVWAFLMPFQGHANRRLRVCLTPTFMEFKVGGHNYEAEWEELASVWVLSDFWVLRLKTGGQFVIPTSALTAPAEALIRAKAKEVEAGVIED
jgi:hypothetical protein